MRTTRTRFFASFWVRNAKNTATSPENTTMLRKWLRIIPDPSLFPSGRNVERVQDQKEVHQPRREEEGVAVFVGHAAHARALAVHEVGAPGGPFLAPPGVDDRAVDQVTADEI